MIADAPRPPGPAADRTFRQPDADSESDVHPRTGRVCDNAAMLAVLLVTFPFFALVLCGYVATRLALLPQAAIPGLNAFVLYFALPCMLWRFGATTPIVQHLTAGLVGVYVACAVAMVAFTIAVTRPRRIGWNDAAFGALVAAFPNTGYMGVPLLIALVGSAAAAPAIVTILLDLVVTSSLCIALSRLGDAGEHGAANAAQSALARRARQSAAVGDPRRHRDARGGPRAAEAARADDRPARRRGVAGRAVHDRRRARPLADAEPADAGASTTCRVALAQARRAPADGARAGLGRDRARRRARPLHAGRRSRWWRRCRARATSRCWPSASARTTAGSRASSSSRPRSRS